MDLADYDRLGIRCDDAVYEVGDVLPRSRAYDDDQLTGEILNGTSVLAVGDDLDAVVQKAERSYFGDHLYLVGGEYGGPGQDRGEILIRDAVVIRVLR